MYHIITVYNDLYIQFVYVCVYVYVYVRIYICIHYTYCSIMFYLFTISYIYT